MAQEFTLLTDAEGTLHLELGPQWQQTTVKVSVEPVSEQQTFSPPSDRQQALEEFFAGAESFPQTPVLTFEDMSRETLYGLR